MGKTPARCLPWWSVVTQRAAQLDDMGEGLVQGRWKPLGSWLRLGLWDESTGEEKEAGTRRAVLPRRHRRTCSTTRSSDSCCAAAPHASVSEQTIKMGATTRVSSTLILMLFCRRGHFLRVCSAAGSQDTRHQPRRAKDTACSV